MGTKSAVGLLTSVDSMFTTQEERDNAQRSYLTVIPTAESSDFPDHPFKVRMDESMTELADSVKERGVLHPVLVRPMPDGGYQMVAGHRRKMAAELAGLPTVPCIVRELTDDEAVIIMVDSNLQRDQVLPSEKAFAYVPKNKYHKMFIEKWYLVLYQIQDDTVYVDYILDCRQDYSWLVH